MSATMLKDFIDGFKGAARSAGRSHSVQMNLPYEQGKQAALARFGNLGTHDALDLAGLGMLGVPLVHDIATDGHEESPWVRRAKKITELAGLGTLAASTLSKH